MKKMLALELPKEVLWQRKPMTLSLANMNSPQTFRHRGFTLIELLTVMVTIAILASLLLPVLGKAKIKAQRTTCLSNLRQLSVAWVLYADDNQGFLPESYPVDNPDVWVQGDMTKADEAGNADLIRAGKLFRYNESLGIYHCPADRGVTIDSKVVPTLRSYSMNCFMGGRDPNRGMIPDTARGFTPFYTKDSDIPQPSELWVMLDEDERSINDAFFVTDPTAQVWIDFPAMSEHRHSLSYALNFGDGHSAIWGLTDSRSFQVSMAQTEQTGNADLARLARATVTKP
jgi:prepilin-type N-terminal cleavage/methylation domain-containing protein